VIVFLDAHCSVAHAGPMPMKLALLAELSTLRSGR
jgi:hypothetical protein